MEYRGCQTMHRFIGAQLLGAFEIAVSHRHTPVPRWVRGESARVRIKLDLVKVPAILVGLAAVECGSLRLPLTRIDPRGGNSEDRKSTRLNSSHRCISYAVF